MLHPPGEVLRERGLREISRENIEEPHGPSPSGDIKPETRKRTLSRKILLALCRSAPPLLVRMELSENVKRKKIICRPALYSARPDKYTDWQFNNTHTEKCAMMYRFFPGASSLSGRSACGKGGIRWSPG